MVRPGLSTDFDGVLDVVGPTGKFLDPWLHLLDDRDGQSKFQFQLAASLHAASETPFLSGWIFHATPNVLPPPNQMQGNLVWSRKTQENPVKPSQTQSNPVKPSQIQ